MLGSITDPGWSRWSDRVRAHPQDGRGHRHQHAGPCLLEARGARRGELPQGPGEDREEGRPAPGGWEAWQQGGGRVTAGHVPYALFREHLPEDVRYMTFLREPVDRVLSHYHSHVRETGTASDDRKRARGVVLASSVEEALELGVPQLTNLATRFLCGRPYPNEKLPATALEDAKANLRQFAFVGIQERFEESIVLLQRTLGLDLVPYLNRHVGLERPRVDEIPEEQRAIIADHNRLDTELYRFGRGLFEDALAGSDDGFAADVERLQRLAADANEEAVEDARAFLDTELPPGATKPKADLFAAAAAAGVSAAALKHLSKLWAVDKRRNREGQVVWTRSEDVLH